MESYCKQDYIDILKKELVPAMGCTEPIALAYAAAKAREVLGEAPKIVEAFVSPNILKNGMGVGIPGTGMIGLEIAGAIGIVGGDASKELNVLADITYEDVKQSQQMLAEQKIKIGVKSGINPVYIEVNAVSGESNSKVIIEDKHNNIVYIEKNGQEILNNRIQKDTKEESKDVSVENKAESSSKASINQDTGKSLKFSVESIYDFSVNMPLEELSFVYDLTITNSLISNEGMEKNYGHRIGRIVQKNIDNGLIADDLMSYVIKKSAAGADARMGGCMLPAMSNSGSGNQGITLSVPVIACAEKLGSDKEKLTRALVLASLISIYIKSNMKRLSALCGAMTAGASASCGMTYLLGGSLEQVKFSVQNMIGNLTGIVCDGAKPNCAMKVASGVSAAVISSLAAMDNVSCTSLEGIVDDNVDKSIANLGKIAAYGMADLDKMMLEIMVDKKSN